MDSIVVFLVDMVIFFIMLYFGIILHIIFHESGHLIGGLISGYNFISFRIGNLILVRDNQKLKLVKYSIPGTLGQCLMLPPKNYENNYSVTAYLLGGIMGNILLSIIWFIVFLSVSNTSSLKFYSIIIVFLGILITAMNGIPMNPNGITNDGKNIMILKKDPASKRAFWIQMQIMGLLSMGIRMKDMPAEWFEIPGNVNLNNPIIIQSVYMKISRLYDAKDIESAEALSEWLLNNASGLGGPYKFEIFCGLLLYELLGECRPDEIDKLYSKDLQKYLKSTPYIISHKSLMYAYELLYKRNEARVRLLLNDFEKIALKYPFSAEIESEREIIQMVVAKSKINGL